nr:CDP-alcohol phosphatidyltransferase family protein [Methanosalsum zhilinae]
MFNQLKSTIRSSIIPIAKFVPLSPNTLTFLGFAISVLAAGMFANGFLIIGGIFVLLSGVFDLLDGAVARVNNSITTFGGFLDSVCDRYADAIVFAGVIYGSITGSIAINSHALGMPLWFWCILALIGSYIVSYTRSRAEAEGAINMNIGLAERSERMILLSIGAFTGFLTIAIVIIALITHITIVQRILHARKYLE